MKAVRINSPTLATCSSCRRYRKVVHVGQGKLLCLVCREEGERSCRSCGQNFPAGYGRACESCYWVGSYAERLRIASCSLRPEFAEKYSDFLQFYFQNQGGKKASLMAKRLYIFFVELEETFGEFPSCNQMIETVGPAKMRKYFAFSSWLRRCDGYIDRAAEERASILEQISNMRLQWASIPYGRLLTAFDSHVTDAVQKGEICPRTHMLYLRSALKYMEFCHKGNYVPFENGSLRQYLKHVPGQRNSLSRFLSYAKLETGVKYRPPDYFKRPKRHGGRKNLEERVISRVGGIFSRYEEILDWFDLSFEYFYGIRGKFKMGWNIDYAYRIPDGPFVVGTSGEEYLIPDGDLNI